MPRRPHPFEWYERRGAERGAEKKWSPSGTEHGASREHTEQVVELKHRIIGYCY